MSDNRRHDDATAAVVEAMESNLLREILGEGAPTPDAEPREPTGPPAPPQADATGAP